MRVSNLQGRAFLARVMLFVLAVGGFFCSWASAQQRISLAGYWQRWIAGQLYDTVLVPSSYRPVGTAILTRTFEFPQLTSGQRLLVHFEGIAGNGRLRLNGQQIGTLAPYTPHVFDITDDAKPGANRIEMELVDWQTPLGLGPAAAWEASGGIIYDAYAEVRSDPYIENARLSYRLSPDFKSTDCSLDVFVRANAPHRVHLGVDLLYQQENVAHVEQDVEANAGITAKSIHWTVNSVHLWSPADPALYQLIVTLGSAGARDTFTTNTGFRSLVVEGNKFLLNGHPFVFQGVARHGMWLNQGYTLSPEQMEQDFRMIKSMGANSIRLVHYPHAPHEIEIAARLGLFVTQESGLTWIDFSKAPRSTLQTGIDILERVVRRDWNNPAFWAILLANESTPTLDVMKEARQRIKALEPTILISTPGPSATDHTIEAVRRLFDDAEFDFYSNHPYTYDERHFSEVLDQFGQAKPMVFTEWGGPVGKLPSLMDREVRALGTLVEQGRLSGTYFWEWADMTQYEREDISMDGPTLAEGVVTANRKVRDEVFSKLSELYRYNIGVPVPAPRAPVLLPSPRLTAGENSTYATIPLQLVVEKQTSDWQSLQAANVAFWKENFGDYLQKTSGEFTTWDAASVRIGPVPFETAQVSGHTRPVVVRTGSTVEIPIHAEAGRLHFLGNVTIPDGYPTRGEGGDQTGSYTIYYADGSKQEIALRWGLEVTRANLISSATLLNPVAQLSTPVIKYAPNESYEDYRTFLYSAAVQHKTMDHIAITMKPLPSERPLISLPNETGSGYAAGETTLLLFALTVERY